LADASTATEIRMPSLTLTQDLVDEYEKLFALAAIRPEHQSEIDAVVTRIFDPHNLAQYRQVEESIKVPAHVVGIIHSLEADLNFLTHLHNGDPLTARTIHVPAGRPRDGDPPFQWFDSAIDALTMHDLDKWTNWTTISGIAFVLERYNGFGYRLNHPQVKSPYLWSFTTIYTAGRYIADGVFSNTSVSRQCGGMALLKRMIEQRKVSLVVPATPPDTGEVELTPKISPEGGAAAPPSAPPPDYPGHVVQIDMTGPDVTNIQKRLLALGIDPGGVDDVFGEQTRSAVKLFQARTVDETGAPLEIDGVVGQKTWAALFGRIVPAIRTAPPAVGSLLAEVLRVAAGEVGVMEVPLGSNRGPRVDEFLNSVGPGLLGQPWCMAFIYFCFVQAAQRLGVANPAPRTAGVQQSWRMAQSITGIKIVPHEKAMNDPSLVTPGMVFYIDTGGGHGHAGFVDDVIGGTLVTTEGNTNENGSSNGIGVFHRTQRKIKDISIGFIAFA
jgi:lysozyme family protein